MMIEEGKRIQVEYIWLDGDKPQKLRSKTRILYTPVFYDLMDVNDINLPDWSYDGSSTKQADTGNSEIILKPDSIFKDPFSGDLLVMCDSYYPDGKPLESNHRHFLKKVIDEKDKDTWYGFEQEYVMKDRKTGKPYGWPKHAEHFPDKQGNYYCGVGANFVIGRDIAMEHLRRCLEARVKISGINAEVMLGQWEYQVGPVSALQGSDQLWISRYILYRIGEIHNIGMNIDPKPIAGKDWNGSGMHVNFSTGEMRDKENIKSGKTIELIEEACEKLEQNHKEHIELYGEGNEERLTGYNETASYEKFTWGYGDRGASIRVPNDVKNKKAGYLEDRRPSSNGDPYIIVKKLIETIC